LIARSARCDVRWVPPSSSDLAERKSVVPPSPPADRRREHRESAYFVVVRRGKAPPLTSPQHGGARFADTAPHSSLPSATPETSLKRPHQVACSPILRVRPERTRGAGLLRSRGVAIRSRVLASMRSVSCAPHKPRRAYEGRHEEARQGAIRCSTWISY
jgi:hypothetical protein